MKIGYARVSKEDQRMDLQIAALKAQSCDRIFSDHGQSGQCFDRAGLENMLQALSPGDTLVVWRLDRLGRSLSKLVVLMEQLGKRGVELQSLSENIDTATAGGRLVFHMMAALAEFERSLISERTCAGLSAAKDRGQKLGRPRTLTSAQIDELRRLMAREKTSLIEMARRYSVSQRTLKRRLAEVHLR